MTLTLTLLSVTLTLTLRRVRLEEGWKAGINPINVSGTFSGTRRGASRSKSVPGIGRVVVVACGLRGMGQGAICQVFVSCEKIWSGSS
jgi:hypothetical protein